MKNVKIKKLVTLSLLCAAALIIFSVEAAIPPLVPIQGVKLGLANVITLFLILTADKRSAFEVLLVRIVLSAIFAGQAVSLIYSLCGGILALISMCAADKLLKGEPVWFISMIGAVFHNIGQITAAAIMMSRQVVYYLPFLMISGVITGVLTGITADVTIKQMDKSGLLKKFQAVFNDRNEEK